MNLRGVRIASLAVSLVALASIAGAQGKRGVILDQTNLPLPGVRIDVYRGDQLIQNTVTGGDGTFELCRARPPTRWKPRSKDSRRRASPGPPPIASCSRWRAPAT